MSQVSLKRSTPPPSATAQTSAASHKTRGHTAPSAQKAAAEVGSLYIPYIATRNKEKHAKAKSNVHLAEVVDSFDRKMVTSVPGRLDAREESEMTDEGKAVIQAYEHAWRAIDIKNRRIRKAQIIAGVAHIGLALAGTWLFGGGLPWLIAAAVVGVIGTAVNKILGHHIRSPFDIDNLAKENPKLGKILHELDRSTLSRPHWVDPEELAQMPKDVQKAYKEVLAEVRAHNRGAKAKAEAASAGSTVVSLAGTILPGLLSVPNLVVNIATTVLTLGLRAVAALFRRKVVPVQ